MGEAVIPLRELKQEVSEAVQSEVGNKGQFFVPVFLTFAYCCQIHCTGDVDRLKMQDLK